MRVVDDRGRRIAGWAEGLTPFPGLLPTEKAHLIVAVPGPNGRAVARPRCGARVVVSHEIGPAPHPRLRLCSQCLKVARKLHLRIPHAP